jgi:hypothetical protein
MGALSFRLAREYDCLTEEAQWLFYSVQRHSVSDQLTDSAVFVRLDLPGESGKPGCAPASHCAGQPPISDCTPTPEESDSPRSKVAKGRIELPPPRSTISVAIH